MVARLQYTGFEIMTKRKKKITLFGGYEGDREGYFLSALVDIYEPKKSNINHMLENQNGGTPNSFVGKVLKENSRSRSFAWFDEDFDPHDTLRGDVRLSLARVWCIKKKDIEDFNRCLLRHIQEQFNPNKRRPNLIISQPVCVESMILDTLGYDLPFEKYDPTKRDDQITALKDRLRQVVNGEDEEEYYKRVLNKAMLEEKRKTNPQLNLLLSMFEK